jgi:hypothetical protein
MEHEDFRKLLQEQLVYWQKLLRLSDWDIKIDFWPHAALEDAVGKVIWSRFQKTATMAFRIPEDIPPVERDFPENEAADYDLTIVHELMHLKCINMESKVEWAEEQLANHMARALVSLYREHIPKSARETVSSGPVLGQAHGHYL